MAERIINKTLRTKSYYDMKERIRIAEQSGYSLVGRVIETREGTFQALMRKVVVFKERS